MVIVTGLMHTSRESLVSRLVTRHLDSLRCGYCGDLQKAALESQVVFDSRTVIGLRQALAKEPKYVEILAASALIEADVSRCLWSTEREAKYVALRNVYFES